LRLVFLLWRAIDVRLALGIRGRRPRARDLFLPHFLCFLTHSIGFFFFFFGPSDLPPPARLSEGLAASPLPSIQHLRRFQCFSTLNPVCLNTSSWFPLFFSASPQPSQFSTGTGGFTTFQHPARSGGWVSQLVMPWPPFLSLTPPALGRHHASLVRSLRVLGSCVTCRGSTSSAMPGGMTGCRNSDPQQNTGSLKPSCELPPAGCAPLASKPIPWEFFRAQPTQTHASACGIWRMAWFPLMLTYFLAFPALHRRRISRRRILQSPKAASIRSPEDDRAHPPPLLILRPLLPRPVSAAIP
jgi:hypothetical protein